MTLCIVCLHAYWLLIGLHVHKQVTVGRRDPIRIVQRRDTLRPDRHSEWAQQNPIVAGWPYHYSPAIRRATTTPDNRVASWIIQFIKKTFTQSSNTQHKTAGPQIDSRQIIIRISRKPSSQSTQTADPLTDNENNNTTSNLLKMLDSPLQTAVPL